MTDNKWAAWDKIIPTAEQLAAMTDDELTTRLDIVTRQAGAFEVMWHRDEQANDLTRATLLKSVKKSERSVLESLWKSNAETMTGVESRLREMAEIYKEELDRRKEGSDVERVEHQKARIAEGFKLLEEAYELLEPYIPEWAESELVNVMGCVVSMLRDFDNDGGLLIKGVK